MISKVRWLTVLAAIAVVVAVGCSKAPADTGTSDSGVRQQAMQFSACMRANGVKDFPDPDASGELTIDAIANRTAIDTNAPAFEQALTACKDLQPPGFTGHTRTSEQQQTALQFAQCIRDNGVKDFPDPTPESPLVDTDRIPSAATSNGMSILNAAMKACGARFAGGLGLSDK